MFRPKIRALFRRRDLAGDLREEIEAHLQMHLEDSAPRENFGNTTQIGENARAEWHFPAIENVI